MSDVEQRIATYDANWQRILDQLEPDFAQGRDLGQLIARYDAIHDTYSGFIDQDTARSLPSVELGKFAGQDVPPNRLVVIDGRYAAVSDLPEIRPVVGLVERLADPAVDCIVEFGAGLGFNLARLRRRLGERPITYVACEPTAAGRATAERLFAAESGFQGVARPFDYHHFDLSFLRQFRRVVAFTCHSIEQVVQLRPDFYDALLTNNVVACAHAEPVGWQRYRNLADEARTLIEDRVTWAKLLPHWRFIPDDDKLVENSAKWAAGCRYNTNLLEIISRYAEAGLIRLEVLDYEAVGDNPFNPSTLIAWRRAR
ncbi:MAG TPA: hypothetical protein VK196_03155 [Magnetospirillum sp.]|nr:hypothetical protein [Magnetospirillum sp.]